MNNSNSSAQYFDKITELLNLIKSKVSEETDVVWSRYATPQHLSDDLNEKIAKLKLNDHQVLNDLCILFGPTSSFQEISISNGWGDEFLEIAEKFDLLHEKLK
ncbi:hypothetical protein ACFQZS_10915 [Mucilaginibacter calamicampi]|uniref:Uncharacterized protein n=1 Tax=Mucilaginibacter calamicampi TaxID=1302352 RepID=A0ABW2YZ12_9SPHI